MELKSRRHTVPDPAGAMELCYTNDVGPWQKRMWKSIAGELVAGVASALLPAERPFVGYLLATDERGLGVSTTHIELNQ